MLLVVIPVHEKDVHLALASLDYCLTLDNRCDFPCLVASERGTPVDELLTKARSYFASVDLFVYDAWTGDPTWPHGPNWAFQNVARHIEATKRLQHPWLWWEPDAVPLAPGWLATLDLAYQHGQRPFAGAITVQPQAGGAYMPGVAIYPPHMSRHCPTAMLTRSQPWDIVASTRDGILHKVHDITPLICHTPLTPNTHFDNRDDIAREIPDTALVFHKCKDGSLLDVLTGRTGSATGACGTASAVQVDSKAPATPASYPSFTEQTRYPSGYFTFPAATNTAYFNPSVLDVTGDGSGTGLHLFTRRWRYNMEQISGGALQGNRNDLAIWRIRSNMSLEPTPIIPATPNRYPHEQWEDPRAIRGTDGRVYVAFATWVHHKDWAIRQSLTRLTPDLRKIEPLFEPAYGGNHPRPTPGKDHEKNWVWFQHGGQWHCQYSINPGDVFRVDPMGTVVDRWSTKEARHDWTTGLPLRGGTPPTRLGDELIAFFHTSVAWQKPKRRYFMGAYAFDASPPFALRRITPEPLLVGSEHDFRVLGGPLVIFPGGAHYDTASGDWTVVFGVNDEACGWIRIPHADLDSMLQPVRRTVMERLVEALA